MLAAMFPVSSDSEQYEPTLSSFRAILADSVNSQPPVMLKAALLGLPNLFLSLAVCRDGHGATSAKYLSSMMDSFRLEDLVVRFIQSDDHGIQISAMLSMARLARVHAASSLVASDKHGEGTHFSDSSSYLWEKLDPSINDMHTILLSMLSPKESSSLPPLIEDSNFQATLCLPLLPKAGFSPFCFAKLDSPRQMMASMIYLLTILPQAPETILRSSKALEFFSDRQHYSILHKLAQDMDCGTMIDDSVSTQIPPPVWFFLMPFFGYGTPTQTHAATMFGRILFNNGCRVFSSFFITKSDQAALNQISNETARKAVDKLFAEIDVLFGMCGLGRDVLFSREIDISSSHSGESPRVVDAGVAVKVFASMAQWSPLNTTIGPHIFERSLLALCRIWVASSGGCAFTSNEDPTIHSSLAGKTFDCLHQIFKFAEKSKGLLEHVDKMLSRVLVEFFLPPSQHMINVKTRYRLLSVFIGAFLLPRSVAQSLQTHGGFEGANAIEIIEFVDSIYPSIFAQMIIDEDHEAIQLCAAFRMYLVHEAKYMQREEEKVQKKNLIESIIGTRKSQRSGSNSRSLVPGVSISTTKLIEQTKLLCIKTEFTKYVIPRLLLHRSRAPLRFFIDKVCQGELDYPAILHEIGTSVLKALVWELGGDDPEEDSSGEIYDSSEQNRGPKRKQVLLAITKGYLLKEGESLKLDNLLLSSSQNSSADDQFCSSTAGSWISKHFMFLLVEIVINKWKSRFFSREKFQVIKCLRAMLQFLPSSDAPQYMPHILTAINRGLSVPMISGDERPAKLRFITVSTLFEYIKFAAKHDAPKVGENLTAIVVALFPLFDNNEGEIGPCYELARKRAVEMLEWLASGEADKSLPQYFGEIPFLPFSKDLERVRSLLAKQGVQLDDVRLLSQQQGGLQEGIVGNDRLESRFYARMQSLSRLVMSHENRRVRLAVITHMTCLIKANRDLFQKFVINESRMNDRFLTVVHDQSSREDSNRTLNAGPGKNVFLTQ